MQKRVFKRTILALLIVNSSVTAANAVRLCKDVPLRGKPACPVGASPVCVGPVHCLTSQFPAISYQACEAWTCKVPAESSKAATPKQ